MEHVVFFPAHDGSPAFRRVASLEDALRLVEHLRNTEGVEQVAVYSLSEVPLAFKAYYRVEVPEEGPATEPTAQAAEEVPAVEAPQVAPPAVPEQETPAATEPQPSSLGFFAR